MEDFSYCNPTQVEFGKDKEKILVNILFQKMLKKY